MGSRVMKGEAMSYTSTILGADRRRFAERSFEAAAVALAALAEMVGPACAEQFTRHAIFDFPARIHTVDDVLGVDGTPTVAGYLAIEVARFAGIVAALESRTLVDVFDSIAREVQP